jgi:UDP-glucose 4-epimerase
MSVTIFGDGDQTRDFVNIRDVAQANYQAALGEGVSGAFNIAGGTRITIRHLAELMIEAGGIRTAIEYGPPRPGDVRHSLADISAARQTLGYKPSVELAEGLVEYMEWARHEGV